ncbi:MAG: glutamate 5-kinase [Pelagibacterales bacterium]|nr:glutamate 5-kinase [Pelagibacterales bacterium]
MKLDLEKRKKIVIKIGSSLLVEKGALREKWLKKFAVDVSDLVKSNFQITIVSSGAIALGKSFLKVGQRKLSLEEKQAAAAIGQIQLMGFYRDFFAKCNLNVAQILLTASDCNDRDRYLNSKNTIETLLKNQIVPIINENDTVAVDEIKIGDNDRLAARVAQMISADIMILFSDIDGLYDKNPKVEKSAKLIKEVFEITKEVENMAGGAVSSVGTGGMITKILAAKMLANSGCDAVITNGVSNNALKKLVNGQQNFTIFHSKNIASKSRKKWLSGFFNPKGEIIINSCAVEALQDKKISLLPIGAIAVQGNFKKGEAVFIKDEKGNHIASGISNYDVLDVKRILEKKSTEVKKILGKSAKSELVHIDNLVVI